MMKDHNLFLVNIQNEYHLHQTGVRVIGLASGPYQSTQFVRSTQLSKKATEDQKRKFGKLLAMRPQCIGDSLVHVIKYAPSGSGWLIDDGVLYKIPNLTKNDFQVVTGFPP